MVTRDPRAGSPTGPPIDPRAGAGGVGITQTESVTSTDDYGFDFSLGLNKSYLSMVDRSIKSNIRYVGRNVIVWYRTSESCNCTTDVDYFYGTGGFNPNCGTCHGTGLTYTDTPKAVRCIVNKFIGNRSFIDEKQTIQTVYSDTEIKLTCLLEDALVNVHSVMGTTYFTGADKVKVDNRYYQPESEKRILNGRKYILEVVLNEVNR